MDIVRVRLDENNPKDNEAMRIFREYERENKVFDRGGLTERYNAASRANYLFSGTIYSVVVEEYCAGSTVTTLMKEISRTEYNNMLVEDKSEQALYYAIRLYDMSNGKEYLKNKAFRKIITNIKNEIEEIISNLT